MPFPHYLRAYLLVVGFSTATYAQFFHTEFSRHDTLRGRLSPQRSCYDVTYYELTVRVNPADSSLRGMTRIHYKTTAEFTSLQIDLFANMQIDSILQEKKKLPLVRDSHATFVYFPEKQQAGSSRVLTVYYRGKPHVAKMPPWDGGFVWAKDQNGNDWVGVAVQGIGASLWWPNKDHLSDEPDSMTISIEAPSDLKAVANGRLRKITPLQDGFTRWEWHVSYPINNYNVTLNIADYAHFRDYYIKGEDTLSLDYYVLPYHLEAAKKHFQEVHAVLECFERHFGPYPFRQDGYKLVETPYLGMEHQSAIAYGNRYKKGYLDRDPIGLGFDYIIVHETAHEWWGNSISVADLAEMWIHESFGTYAEAIYVECRWGYEKALQYMWVNKFHILNKEPILGPVGVNFHHWIGSDIYYKGAWMLHTLRHIVNNDSLWWKLLYDLATEYALSIVSTEQIIAFFSRHTGQDLRYFFEQYLHYPNVPIFVYRIKKRRKNIILEYRWEADVKDFRMPLKIILGKNRLETIHPTLAWQQITLRNVKPTEFQVGTDYFLINVREEPIGQ